MLYATLCFLSVKQKARYMSSPIFLSTFNILQNIKSLYKFPKENEVDRYLMRSVPQFLARAEFSLNWAIDIKSTKCVILTFVAASTLASLCSSSETTSTWPSLEARWRAFNPFWSEGKALLSRLKTEEWTVNQELWRVPTNNHLCVFSVGTWIRNKSTHGN